MAGWSHKTPDWLVDEYAPADVDLNGDLNRLLGGDARRTDGEPERQRVSAEWVCRGCMEVYDEPFCPIHDRNQMEARPTQNVGTRANRNVSTREES